MKPDYLIIGENIIEQQIKETTKNKKDYLKKFKQKINAEFIPLLKVHIFSPFGKVKILIIVPLHEHVANLSPSLLRHIFNIGLFCAWRNDI